MHEQNIELMNQLNGFDVIIVCTSTPNQAEYWQKRLVSTRGSISPEKATIVAVHEDWNDSNGAGNGLGTLYAYKKAIEKAKNTLKIDLSSLLMAQKISIALYHTAGKGTRLAPLPASENNNKSGVKLPSMIEVSSNQTQTQHESHKGRKGRKSDKTVTIQEKNGLKQCTSFVPMTILEAVIKQTGVYAASRKGRLSVFWGDQVFIPSETIMYESKHYIDILAALAPMPSREEWEEKGLEKYGLIAVNHKENAAQVDKVSYETAKRLLATFGELKSVGTSLGSFSIDAALLEAFLTEFQRELNEKTKKLDTDPHFWMPLTLNLSAYIELMTQKGSNTKESTTHFERMHEMLEKFYAGQSNVQDEKAGTKKELFGCVNVGSNVYWWDYGQLQLYLQNNLLLIDTGIEAKCLRSFLGVGNEKRMEANHIGKDTHVTNSIVSFSKIVKGTVESSVLTGVYCKEIDISNSVLINVTAEKIKGGKNCILYNLIDEDLDRLLRRPLNQVETNVQNVETSPRRLQDGTVLVGVFLPSGEKMIIESNIKVCGGKEWKKIIKENAFSFETVYRLNANANVNEIEATIEKEHKRKRQTIFA